MCSGSGGVGGRRPAEVEVEGDGRKWKKARAERGALADIIIIKFGKNNTP